MILLVIPPPPQTMLLRSEQLTIGSAEFTAVRWIRDSLSRARGDDQAKKGFRFDPLLYVPTPLSSSFEQQQQPSSSVPHSPLVKDQSDANSPATYTFFEPATLFPPNSREAATSPIPLTFLSSPLSPKQRAHVDRQLGALVSHLSSLRSPSGRFGPLAAIVPGPGREYEQYQQTGGLSAWGMMGPDYGAGSMLGAAVNWSTAFHSMLEAVLRDGEDMGVTLSYSAIRRNFRRWRHLLDGVRTARLVVLYAGHEANVLVVKSKTNVQKAGADGDEENTTLADDVSGPEGEAQQEGEKEETETWELAGFRDWSNCFFGDPLLATVFSHWYSDAFMEGFNNSTNPTTDTDSVGTVTENNTTASSTASPSPSSSTTSSRKSSLTPLSQSTVGCLASDHQPIDNLLSENLQKQLNLLQLGGSLGNGRTENVIEDFENSGTVRLLLYQVYYAALCIVKEFFRPRRGEGGIGSQIELEARKRMTEALVKLEGYQQQQLQQNHLKKKKHLHPRPESERSSEPGGKLGEGQSPAKRAKSVGQDESSER